MGAKGLREFGVRSIQQPLPDNVEFFVEKCMDIVGKSYMTIYSGSERLNTLFYS